MSLGKAGCNCPPRSWCRLAPTPPTAGLRASGSRHPERFGLRHRPRSRKRCATSLCSRSKCSKRPLRHPWSPRFKIYLVPDGDFSLTGNLDLKENTNWWWVDLDVFSKAYFEDKTREDARKAEADAARAAEEPQHEPAPPPSTMAELRANVFGQLFEKIPGKKRKFLATTTSSPMGRARNAKIRTSSERVRAP